MMSGRNSLRAVGLIIILDLTGDKASCFSRIDIDDVRDGRSGRIDNVKKGYRLRSGAPYRQCVDPSLAVAQDNWSSQPGIH